MPRFFSSPSATPTVRKDESVSTPPTLTNGAGLAHAGSDSDSRISAIVAVGLRCAVASSLNELLDAFEQPPNMQRISLDERLVDPDGFPVPSRRVMALDSSSENGRDHLSELPLNCEAERRAFRLLDRVFEDIGNQLQEHASRGKAHNPNEAALQIDCLVPSASEELEVALRDMIASRVSDFGWAPKSTSTNVHRGIVRLDELAARIDHSLFDASTGHLLLAVESQIDQDVIERWYQEPIAPGVERSPKVPGEAAVAILFQSPASLTLAPTLASLSAPAMALRQTPIDAVGRLDFSNLTQLFADSIRERPDPGPQFVISDSDYCGKRNAEVSCAMTEALPRLDSFSQRKSIGQLSGSLKTTNWLLALALGAAFAQRYRHASLIVSVDDPRKRLVWIIEPPRLDVHDQNDAALNATSLDSPLSATG